MRSEFHHPGEVVPNTKSAAKRLRQNLRRRTRNKAVRSRLKTAVKKVRAASEPEQAAQLFREAAGLLDRAARRGLIHRNRAARSKGRLAAHVRRLGGTA
jgi:small subunit ribosomal protein S20